MRFRHRTFSHDLTYEVWSLVLPPGPAPKNQAADGSAGLDATRWATPGEVRGLPVRAHTLKAIRLLE